MPLTDEQLRPCDSCDRFTYNVPTRGITTCTPCMDALAYGGDPLTNHTGRTD